MSPQKGSTSVIIIGAGAAGIASAATLLRNNITNVTILEAEDRIGGRVYSVPFGQAVVELGAEWCHGIDNPVHDLVYDHRAELLGRTSDKVSLVRSDGIQFTTEQTVELLELFDELYTPDGDKKQPEGVTVGEYFIGTYNKVINEKYQNNPDKLKLAQSALETFHHYVLTSEGSKSWNDTSATNDYRDCPGNLLLNWRGRGYNVIFDILLGKKYPKSGTVPLSIDNRLHFGKEVTEIQWGRPNTKVLVRCNDGSSYQGDHVIFTGSLGVLKEQGEWLFKPALPKRKIEAIRSLGFAGGCLKVMVEFPKRWWPVVFNGALFVWTEEDRARIGMEYKDGPNNNGYSWLLDMLGIFPVENNLNVLSCWFTGTMVPEIEKSPNETIVKGIMFLLNTFFGNRFKITAPITIKRSNWYTNSHFRGVYTFQTEQSRKSSFSSHDVLAEPLLNQTDEQPRVCFAGEATHPKYYSTVHGAIESGYREANRIIKHNISNNKKYYSSKL